MITTKSGIRIVRKKKDKSNESVCTMYGFVCSLYNFLRWNV